MTHLRLLVPPKPSSRAHGPLLVLTVAPDGYVSPEQDERLGKLALRVTDGDAEALATLYAAYLPRLEHWIRRTRRACFRPSADIAVEPEDIVQEAFIVFADLILAWTGEGSLSAYIVSLYPCRLSDATRRMTETRLPRPHDSSALDDLTDDSYAAEEALALIRSLAADLPDRLGDVLVLRIVERRTWDEIAHELGVSGRTVHRDWQSMLVLLRANLAGDSMA